MFSSEILLKDATKAAETIPQDDLIHAGFDRDFGVPTTDILIVFSTPRSGSTLLCELLYRNGLCLAHEYFQERYYLPILASRWQCSDGRRLDKSGFISSLLKFRTLSNGWLGINLHGEHLKTFLKLESLLPDITFHYLHIQRRDSISQAVSYEIAAQTGQWSGHFKPGREPVYSYYRVLHKLYRIGKQTALINAYLHSRNCSCHSVYYEDFVADPQQTLQRLPFFTLQDTFQQSTGLKRQSGGVNTEWVQRFSRKFLSL
ncbi:MAG: Stf0 family sulfotransferase [Gammaproteobacteria bacterium]|nr:hypothetical protein [Pseudomonadales bacterium]MCP5346139.1 hypothetical protein [Pseudomonadales bacterium]